MTEQQKKYMIRLATGGYYKKKQFKQVFDEYIETGDDLLELLYELKSIRGYGQTIKKSVLRWIYSKSPEVIEKELCKTLHGFDGLTILRLFHPKPITKPYQKAFSNIKSHCLSKRNPT